MRTLRILLQIIFGLLSASIIFVLLKKPGAGLTSDLTMLSIFILFVVILGPCWPSQESIDRWGKRLNFRLPTDNPDVAKYIANYVASAYCFYHAWGVFNNPTRDLWRYEKAAFAIAGAKGVIAFWILLAFVCLIYGAAAHAKSKQS